MEDGRRKAARALRLLLATALPMHPECEREASEDAETEKEAAEDEPSRRRLGEELHSHCFGVSGIQRSMASVGMSLGNLLESSCQALSHAKP